MAFGVVAAAASALLLSAPLLTAIFLTAGGPHRAAPEGPTESQIDNAVKLKLDRQWQLSGLEGIVPRPRYVSAPIVTERQWNGLMASCMRRADVAQWGYDEGSGLFIEGAKTTTSDQLSFYWCFAAYPTVDLVSDAQLDFIYGYYARWLIPCLESRGYNVMNAPSRRDFINADPAIGVWNPYRALERYPPTAVALNKLSKVCAPTIAGIPGWSEQ